MPGEKVPSLTVALLAFFLNLPFSFRLGRASALAQRMTRSVFLTKYFFNFSKHISRESTLAPALATIDLSQFINWKQFKFIIGINWMYLFVVVLKTAPLVWISSCNPTI